MRGLDREYQFHLWNKSQSTQVRENFYVLEENSGNCMGDESCVKSNMKKKKQKNKKIATGCNIYYLYACPCFLFEGTHLT